MTADKPPPGGWTDAARVTTVPNRDMSTWRSVQTYPIGTELTVHAVGEDGPGRQLRHGTVVDDDGPEHVVESPWGTRRTAPLSHVRPVHATVAAPDAAQRWVTLLEQKHPSVTTDPHWPALAALLDRIDSAGGDVPDLVDQVLRDRALPADNPARSLDYRLNDAAPHLARATTPRQPYTPQPVTAPPPAQYAPRTGPTPPR